MVKVRLLADHANGWIAAALPLQFSGLCYGFGLTKCHAVGADAFSCKIKRLPHIGQFHAPTVILAGWRAAIELRPAFIASELLHRHDSCFLSSNRGLKRGGSQVEKGAVCINRSHFAIRFGPGNAQCWSGYQDTTDLGTPTRKMTVRRYVHHNSLG